MSEDDLIAERSITHGDFKSVAAVAQVIRYACREAPGWTDMSFSRREAVDAIAAKIARIVCGNSGFPDHWKDIAGYARLGELADRMGQGGER